MFLHGVGLRAECWISQVCGLRRTHDVFALDLPGHGESALLRSPKPVLSDFVDFVARFMDAEVGRPAVLAGHSAGALIALSVASRFPELCRGVAALNTVYRRNPTAREAVLSRASVLYNCIHHPNTDSKNVTVSTSEHDKNEYEQAVNTTLQRWFGDSPAGSAHRAALLCRRWLSEAKQEGYAALYRVFAQEDGPADDALSSLTSPALFLTGERDLNSSPAMSDAMAKLAPNGRSKVIQGAGHLAILTHCSEVCRELQTFVSECAGCESGASDSEYQSSSLMTNKNHAARAS